MSDLVGNPEDRFSHNEAHELTQISQVDFSIIINLDESTLIFRGIRGDFSNFLISFFDGIHVNKQNSPRWDAAFCGVISGAILCLYVP